MMGEMRCGRDDAVDYDDDDDGGGERPFIHYNFK